MALLTATQVRTHIEVGCGDGALERVIDGADAEIIRRLGPLATQVEVLRGGSSDLHLARKASSITSAVERYAALGISVADYALVAADYNLRSDGRRLERLVTGTNPSSAWNGIVTVTYVPVDQTAERTVLLVNLVKLELAYSGLASKGLGDVQETALEHEKAKTALFTPFMGGGRRLIT